MLPTLPAKTAKSTPSNVTALHDGLTSVIAGHPQDTEPWTFYEELDAYLGPWGSAGYPLGYRKFYCVAFNHNEKLVRDPTTKSWLDRVTVLLQEKLRDFVVERFKLGTLPTLSESELRQFAFASHAASYTDADLANVLLAAPELVPIVISIPGKEFKPTSPSFVATVRQVFETVVLVTPAVVGEGLVALAGPAHTGVWQRAIEEDSRRLYEDRARAEGLAQVRRAIDAGKVDNIAWLDAIIARLNATQFPDEGLRMAAREVVNAATLRKARIRGYYQSVVQDCSQLAPELRRLLDGQCRAMGPATPPNGASTPARGGIRVPERGGAFKREPVH